MSNTRQRHVALRANANHIELHSTVLGSDNSPVDPEPDPDPPDPDPLDPDPPDPDPVVPDPVVLPMSNDPAWLHPLYESSDPNFKNYLYDYAVKTVAYNSSTVYPIVSAQYTVDKFPYYFTVPNVASVLGLIERTVFNRHYYYATVQEMRDIIATNRANYVPNPLDQDFYNPSTIQLVWPLNVDTWFNQYLRISNWESKYIPFCHPVTKDEYINTTNDRTSFPFATSVRAGVDTATPANDDSYLSGGYWLGGKWYPNMYRYDYYPTKQSLIEIAEDPMEVMRWYSFYGDLRPDQ